MYYIHTYIFCVYALKDRKAGFFFPSLQQKMEKIKDSLTVKI